MTRRDRGWIGLSDSQRAAIEDGEKNGTNWQDRDRPFLDDHDRSVGRLAEARRDPPRGLRGLLRWFTAAWTAEVPERLHVVGIEFEKPGIITRGSPVEGGYQGEAGAQVPDGGGGSRIGSRRWSEPFRATISGSAFQVENPSSDFVAEIGVSYATPLRATLNWMERRHPLKAAWLRRLGRVDGDWQSIAATSGLPEEYAESITRDALRFCWVSFREEPPAKPKRKSA